MSPEGFPRQLLQQPISERLAYFRSYTIAHPRLVAASVALQRAIQEPAGGSLVLVIGPTGVGKTTLRLRIEQQLKDAFLSTAGADSSRIPVVGFEAVAPDSGNFSWKDYYRRALRALEEPLIDYKIDYGVRSIFRNQVGQYTVASRVGGTELRQVMEQALHYRQPAAVLIDEAQHLTKMASGRRLSDQLDCLKSLASLTGCVHVLIGTYELLPCRNLSAQLSRRSIDIHFRRYHADDPEDTAAFQRAIFSFERHLPLVEEPELWRDWEYCYAHSMGCVGMLKEWLLRALSEALEKGASTLTRADLERHSWSLDQCEKMTQEILEGESVLAEKPDANARLRRLLGLDTQPSSGGETPANALSRNSPPVNGRPKYQGMRRVGVRRPVRDAIGIQTEER
ncbi:MAG: ATP-binding protein [Acidobacteria bacterium]|nr:ATP-binding protein [Acidobacteriota bacterium]